LQACKKHGSFYEKVKSPACKGQNNQPVYSDFTGFDVRSGGSGKEGAIHRLCRKRRKIG